MSPALGMVEVQTTYCKTHLCNAALLLMHTPHVGQRVRPEAATVNSPRPEATGIKLDLICRTANVLNLNRWKW